MKNRITTLIAVLCLFSTVTNAQTTQKLTATKQNDYAVVYSLPLTAIDVTVVTRKTVKAPGEFYQFAKRILNIENAIGEKSVEYSIDKIIINSHGVPDVNERYAVKFGSGSTPFILLSADNVPLAVNTDEVYTPLKNPVPAPEVPRPTPLETPAAQQVMTEDMLRATTPLKRAQVAAEQLYSLRQSRTDLITGQADQMPPDGQSTQLILDNLNAQEAAITAMFAGTIQESTQIKTFTYIPPSDTTQIFNHVIARLSTSDGIVDADDLSGAPIYLDYRVVLKGEMPVNEKGQQLAFPKNGLPYCIPGKAQVTVTFNNRPEAEATLNMAQAGVVYGVAPNLFTNKKEPAYLVFDPSTGASIEIGSK